MAQNDYPNRLIKLIVPNAAGTVSDALARVLGQELGKRWNVPVVVENRAGAEGRIAARHFVTTPPDGYTFFIGASSTITINPVLYKDPGYAPLKDMTTVALTTRNWLTLSVPASSRIKSVAELVAAAKGAPGKLNMAGGSSAVLIGTHSFMRQANLEMTYVPYRSSAAALNDLLGGQVEAMFVDVSSAAPHVRSGALRVLATTGATRHKWLAEVPTMEESGFPGFEMVVTGMVMAPAGVPASVVEKLNREVRSVFANPDFSKQFTGNGSEVMLASPAEATRIVRDESSRWSELMKRSGLKPE